MCSEFGNHKSESSICTSGGKPTSHESPRRVRGLSRDRLDPMRPERGRVPVQVGRRFRLHQQEPVLAELPQSTVKVNMHDGLGKSDPSQELSLHDRCRLGSRSTTEEKARLIFILPNSNRIFQR